MCTLINVSGHLMDLQSPRVMAIVNITPNSFYSHSCVEPSALLSSVTKAVKQGADMVDIGACSTRPGVQLATEEQEWERLSTALKIVRDAYSHLVISIDTWRANIAQWAIQEYAVDIINDVSGGVDPNMFDVVAKYQIPYVLMHSDHLPATSHSTFGCDIVMEMIDYFQRKIDQLQQKGVKDIIVDPGFGFSKTISQNYQVLNELGYLKVLNKPLLVGLSRKSMLSKVLEVEANDCLSGTIAANTLALQSGASILRVHDVLPAVEAVKIFKNTNRL